MASDIRVNLKSKSFDDRNGESFHTRAKVILSYVSWLLQEKGIRETNGVFVDDRGYVQKFASPNRVKVEVSVVPSEPTIVRVRVMTSPVSNYRVDAKGDDGKTKEITKLATAIADGVEHLLRAIKTPDPDPPKSQTNGERSIDQPRGGGPVMSPQTIAQLTALWDRCRKIDGLKDEVQQVRDAIAAAKAGHTDRVADMLSDLEKDLDPKNKDSILDGILSFMIRSLKKLVGSETDVRAKPHGDSALERLRSVAKVETTAILPRTRGIIDQLKETWSDQELPDEDSFSNDLSPAHAKDFQKLVGDALYKFCKTRFQLDFQDHLNAWSLRSRRWSVSFRTETARDGVHKAWGQFGRLESTGAVLNMGRFLVSDSSYEGLALKIALAIEPLLKKSGVMEPERS